MSLPDTRRGVRPLCSATTQNPVYVSSRSKIMCGQNDTESSRGKDDVRFLFHRLKFNPIWPSNVYGDNTTFQHSKLLPWQHMSRHHDCRRRNQTILIKLESVTDDTRLFFGEATLTEISFIKLLPCDEGGAPKEFDFISIQVWHDDGIFLL